MVCELDFDGWNRAPRASATMTFSFLYRAFRMPTGLSPLVATKASRPVGAGCSIEALTRDCTSLRRRHLTRGVTACWTRSPVEHLDAPGSTSSLAGAPDEVFGTNRSCPMHEARRPAMRWWAGVQDYRVMDPTKPVVTASALCNRLSACPTSTMRTGPILPRETRRCIRGRRSLFSWL